MLKSRVSLIKYSIILWFFSFSCFSTGSCNTFSLLYSNFSISFLYLLELPRQHSCFVLTQSSLSVPRPEKKSVTALNSRFVIQPYPSTGLSSLILQAHVMVSINKIHNHSFPINLNFKMALICRMLTNNENSFISTYYGNIYDN